MTAPDRAGVASLAVAQTVVWAGLFYSFPALLPAIAAETGWPIGRVASIFSLTLLAAAATSPIAGALIDRGYGRALLPACAGIGAVALILTAWAPGIIGFALLWGVIGLCHGGALYDPAFSMLTRAYGAEARGPITTVTLVAGFAGTLAFPLCYLLAEIGGWRFAVQGMGAFILLTTVPLTRFALRRIGDGPAPDPETAPDRPVLQRPAFWALAAAYFLLALNVGAVLAHILPLMGDRGIDPGVAVFAAASIGPMQVLGRIAMMRLGRETEERRLIVIGWGAILLALPAIGLAGAGLVFLAAFVALFGAGYGVMSILRPLIVRRVLGPRGYGRKAGLISAAAMLGGAIAPAAGAGLVAISGYSLMLAAGFGVTALGLLALSLAAFRLADEHG